MQSLHSRYSAELFGNLSCCSYRCRLVCCTPRLLQAESVHNIARTVRQFAAKRRAASLAPCATPKTAKFFLCSAQRRALRSPVPMDARNLHSLARALVPSCSKMGRDIVIPAVSAAAPSAMHRAAREDNLLERITASGTRRTASPSMGNAEWARQRIVPGPITPPQCDLSPSLERNAPLLLLPLRAARVRRAAQPLPCVAAGE